MTGHRDRDVVARLELDRRLEAEADTGGRTCCEDIARLQCLSLRNGLDKIRYREDKVVGRSVLSKLAVHMCLHVQHLGELWCWNSDWTLHQVNLADKTGR